jgi:methylenetetrahydrofolate--tRNA-(uracil-5-)-methyltransferase
LREYPQVFFAGQISGVEGYTESIATGMLAGMYAAVTAQGGVISPPRQDRAHWGSRDMEPVPRGTALGSLVRYITEADAKRFQPANITFDLLEPLDEGTRRRVRDKRERHRMQCERALGVFDDWALGVRADARSARRSGGAIETVSGGGSMG